MLTIALGRYAEVDESNYQDSSKYGNQKGESVDMLQYDLTTIRLNLHSFSPAISSDQYFGRGSYDPAAAAEAKSRLQNFSGATAISSNAYHGRPEEDEDNTLADEGGLLGELGQNETVAQLERGIRDMAGRLMANPDVQNLGESLRTGALRVSVAC
jgi:hypothetical protein